MSSANLTKLKRKATDLEQKKQFEKALSLYIQIIDEAGHDLDDADLQLYNRVGDLLMRQGNVSEALAYYEKAVDVYAERGFLNNAIALCNKILRQSPARTAVYYKLGKISASKGFKSDARKNFLEYADRMQKGGHRDEAFRALKEFADLCPDQDDIRLMLADLLSRENRNGEALEQLEQLYSKLESEGRSAEARATMDRIKAIDPDITPRASGAYVAQKSNDLVFLDLGETEITPPRVATPPGITPDAPLAAVEAIDVRGVGALQGLTITFLPDEDPAPEPIVFAEAVASLEGLEVTETPVGEQRAEHTGIPDLETPPRLLEGESQTVAGLDDHPEWVTPDDVVPPIDGLATVAVTLTGAHPSLAPLLDEPPLSGEEFGALHLDAVEESTVERLHDLSLASSLPLMTDEHVAGDVADATDLDDSGEASDGRDGIPGLLEETPDEWVAAALGAPRNDLAMDRLLTPLDSPAIHANDVLLPELRLPPLERMPSADSLGEIAQLSGSFTMDGLVTIPEPELPGLTIDEREDDRAGDLEATGEHAAQADPRGAVQSESTPQFVEPASPLPELELPTFAHTVSADLPLVEEFAPDPVPVVQIPVSTDPPVPVPESAPAHAAVDLADSPRSGDETPEKAATDQTDDAESQRPGAGAPAEDRAPRAAPQLPPEFALEELIAGGTSAHESALDTANLRTQAARDHGRPESVDAERAAEPSDQSMVRSAFEEERVELPLIDLESAALTAEADAPFAPESPELEDLLAAPPTFGEGDETSPFEPAPLDIAPNATTDEWSKPEVLIDGEWRDEHVGDLVSGEMFVVGERRDADPPHDRSTFDDLAAAILAQGDVEGDAPHNVGERLPTPAAPEAFNVRHHASHSTLSFGGLEAQLRRRLELDPSDAVLRRQLGEALLDVGDREQGLNELEIAVNEYEMRGDLAGARDVVDIILRIVPLSVRHHQKRVEYAVRASDRPRLVEAYTELADSLFRCGEPDKARVVYSRVLELAPHNDRARFALSMLSDDAGLPRSSDEIPTIDTGILTGTPSVEMAMLTPESLETLANFELPARDLPYIPETQEPSPPTPAPVAAVDVPDESEDPVPDEVDAAFAEDTPQAQESRRKTSELAAVEEWAAAQDEIPSPRSTSTDDDFVDLGEWLRGTAPERSTRMVTTDVAPTGDEGADFAEMLRRFKQGVAANVEDEDFASHYDLGVAFKEMGLIDEAIAQFQKALRGPEHRVRSYEALGQCFVEKGQNEVAVALLQRAAETSGSDDQRLVGVLYLLGFACEAVGRQQDAVGYYQRVFAVDIEFRDVGRRLAALERNAK
ncbi:MAG: tetratricopeptide repeat protein [Gemmatimonadaceae bacterium]